MWPLTKAILGGAEEDISEGRHFECTALYVVFG